MGKLWKFMRWLLASLTTPVTMALVVSAFAIHFADTYTIPGFTKDYFLLIGSNKWSWDEWWRLGSHALGHGNWRHLFGNLSYLILLLPSLEERYGSITMLVVVPVSAFVGGFLYAVLFPEVRMLGMSGVVFTLITLSAFASFRGAAVPLVLYVVFQLYIQPEIHEALRPKTLWDYFTGRANIAHGAHILGGLIGILWGFLLTPRSLSRASREKESKPTKIKNRWFGWRSSRAVAEPPVSQKSRLPILRKASPPQLPVSRPNTRPRKQSLTPLDLAQLERRLSPFSPERDGMPGEVERLKETAADVRKRTKRRRFL